MAIRAHIVDVWQSRIRHRPLMHGHHRAVADDGRTDCRSRTPIYLRSWHFPSFTNPITGQTGQSHEARDDRVAISHAGANRG